MVNSPALSVHPQFYAELNKTNKQKRELVLAVPRHPPCSHMLSWTMQVSVFFVCLFVCLLLLCVVFLVFCFVLVFVFCFCVCGGGEGGGGSSVYHVLICEL